MKKTLLACALALLSWQSMAAQEDDKMIFNHLSVGVTVGTTGLGIDVATTCTPYLQLRGGVAFFPRFSGNYDFDLGLDQYTREFDQIKALVPEAQKYTVPSKVSLKGRIGFTNGKILADFFPFKSTGFPLFITAGLYFGTSSLVSVYTEGGEFEIVNQANEDIRKFNRELNNHKEAAEYANLKPKDEIYAELGDYKLYPDKDGNMRAEIKVNAVKPYLGIGFGRPVPKKNRVGFVFELGAQFWGTPKVFCNGEELKAENAGGDAGGAIKTISKFKVYPTLSFRLCGRIL